jgi:hypothetical protein
LVTTPGSPCQSRPPRGQANGEARSWCRGP